MEQKTNCSTLIESSKNRGHFVLFGGGKSKHCIRKQRTGGETEIEFPLRIPYEQIPDDTFKTGTCHMTAVSYPPTAINLNHF